MLKERVLSAIVMVIVALAAIFWLPPLAFTIVLSALVVLGMWEWAQFAGFKSQMSRGCGGGDNLYSLVVDCGEYRLY